MPVASISPAALLELSRSAEPIELIDVRTPAEYREVHLSAARNVPLDQLDPNALLHSGASASGKPLYVVCKSGARSSQACEKLIAAGVTNVMSVEGGTVGCIEAGLPVLRGKKAVSIERQVRIAAGSLVLLGAAGSFVFQPLIYLSIFVGAGLVFAGVTDTCGMGLLLVRMPWNR